MPDRASPASPSPDSRALARLPPAWGLLALLVGAVTAAITAFGWDYQSVFADEAAVVGFARAIEADPSMFLHGSLAKGPERLTSLLGAVAGLVGGGTPAELAIFHVLVAAASALAAVPVYALARGLRMSPLEALVPAALAIVGPLAMFSLTFLNGSVGYLCATTLLWTMWRALVRPGLTSDLFVLVALVLTALGRVGWAPIVAALPPAVLVQAWRERPAQEHVATWLKRLPHRIVTRHPLLLPAAAVIVVVVVVRGAGSLIGTQYGGTRLQPHVTLEGLWDNSRLLVSHLALGTGVVALMLAAPALVAQLIRPRDRELGAFAVLVPGILAVFSYAYYLSMNEDRYFLALVPLIAIGFGVAVFRAAVPVWAAALGALAVGRLVVTSAHWPDATPFDVFAAPGSIFFQRVVVGNLAVHLPFDTTEVPTVALLIFGAAALGVAAAVRYGRRLPRPAGIGAAAVLLTGMFAYQAAAGLYAPKEFVDGVGRPGISFAQMSFVDELLGVHDAQPLMVDGGLPPQQGAELRELQTFNRSVGRGFAVFRGRTAWSAFRAAAKPAAMIDPATGHVRLRGAPPHVLLELADGSAAGFAGDPTSSSAAFPYVKARRLRLPLRARYVVEGNGGPSPLASPPAGGPDLSRPARPITVPGGLYLRRSLHAGPAAVQAARTWTNLARHGARGLPGSGAHGAAARASRDGADERRCRSPGERHPPRTGARRPRRRPLLTPGSGVEGREAEPLARGREYHEPHDEARGHMQRAPPPEGQRRTDHQRRQRSNRGEDVAALLRRPVHRDVQREIRGFDAAQDDRRQREEDEDLPAAAQRA
jgi:hypothetical protein